MDKEKETRRPPYPTIRRTSSRSAPVDRPQEAAESSGYDIQDERRLARQGKIGAVKKARN